MNAAPVVIVADTAAADRWIEERVAEGFRRRDDLPAAPWDLEDRRWVTTTRLDVAASVGQIVIGVLRGVATVVVDDVGATTREARELLDDDLARIAGPIQRSDVANPTVDAPGVELDAETRELLALIAGGASMAEAATAVHLSLRTAERRLTAARKALGVRTTAEAVARVVG